MATLYTGPKLSCTFCVYEIDYPADDWRNYFQELPIATQLVNTKNGPRELCDAHAAKNEKKVGHG